MAGQVNIGGNTASVQLTGNDAITADQEIGFPNTNGESAVVIVTPTSQDIETTGDIECNSLTAANSINGSFIYAGDINSEFSRLNTKNITVRNDDSNGESIIVFQGGTSNADKKIVLKSDGSINDLFVDSFKDGSGEYIQLGSNVALTDDGNTEIINPSERAAAFILDPRGQRFVLAGAQANGNLETVVTTGFDGSITAAGSITLTGPGNFQTANGAFIAYADSSNDGFVTYQTSSNVKVVSITGNGDGDFEGFVSAKAGIRGSRSTASFNVFEGSQTGGAVTSSIKADGSSSFASTINCNGPFASNRNNAGDYCFQGKQGGVEKSYIRADGNASFVSTFSNNFIIETERGNADAYKVVGTVDEVEEITNSSGEVEYVVTKTKEIKLRCRI